MTEATLRLTACVAADADLTRRQCGDPSGVDRDPYPMTDAAPRPWVNRGLACGSLLHWHQHAIVQTVMSRLLFDVARLFALDPVPPAVVSDDVGQLGEKHQQHKGQQPTDEGERYCPRCHVTSFRQGHPRPSLPPTRWRTRAQRKVQRCWLPIQLLPLNAADWRLLMLHACGLSGFMALAIGHHNPQHHGTKHEKTPK